MNLKKVLALTEALVMSITALAGCGNSGPDSLTASQSSQDNSILESKEDTVPEEESEAREKESGEKTAMMQNL